MLHEMTRTTAAERAKFVRVESYDVALDLARGAELFGSTSVIRFSCVRPGAASHADLLADKVHEIILNGRQLDRSRYAQTPGSRWLVWRSSTSCG